MAFVLADRVKETTTTAGTGTVTLLGASTGYQSFSAIGNGNTTYYVIAGQTTSEWEVGIGTYTSAGTTLSRTTVLSSSNSGSLVNFSAGTKDVFVSYPASKSVNLDASGNVSALGTVASGTWNATTLAVAYGGTGLTTATGVLVGAGSSVSAVAAGTNGNVLTSNGTTWVSQAASGGGFAAGTLMLFQQTAAPTGWTKQTTHDNKALRVVTGAASSGGTSSFTTVFANQTPTITTSGLSAGATTLTTSQIPSHTHTTNTGGIQSSDPSSGCFPREYRNPGSTASGATGGGGSHTHSISGSATSSAVTLNVQYVDLIIASKD